MQTSYQVCARAHPCAGGLGMLGAQAEMPEGRGLSGSLPRPPRVSAPVHPAKSGSLRRVLRRVPMKVLLASPSRIYRPEHLKIQLSIFKCRTLK